MSAKFPLFMFIGAIAAAGLAAAGNAPDFSGTWTFSPAKSKNVGMMSQMKLTATIRQTATELITTSVSDMNGDQQTTETRFDLTGKPVVNETPMGAKADTVSTWQGDKLVTTWTSEGSVAGTKSVRTETRSLSNDGRTMVVESTRAQRPSIVMVYERK